MSGYITLALVAVTVLVSWQAWERPRLLERLILWPPAIDRQQQYDRLLTHGFIHADGMHLIFNMITLYSFGQAMERYFSARITPVGYLLFYLSAVVIAILPTFMKHRHDAGYRSLGARPVERDISVPDSHPDPGFCLRRPVHLVQHVDGQARRRQHQPQCASVGCVVWNGVHAAAAAGLGRPVPASPGQPRFRRGLTGRRIKPRKRCG
jgi:hypothetical protein